MEECAANNWNTLKTQLQQKYNDQRILKRIVFTHE